MARGGPCLDLGVGAELDLDARALELGGHDLDGARAEDGQRRALGRDERDLGVHAHAARVARDEQGELVGGQRPAGPGRDDDRQALAVALFEVAQQPADGLDAARVVPREDVVEGRLGARARGEHQRVVGELLAVAELHGLGPRRRRRPAAPGRRRAPVARVASASGVAALVAEREGLGDRQRAVDEVRGGGDERQRRRGRPPARGARAGLRVRRRRRRRQQRDEGCWVMSSPGSWARSGTGARYGSRRPPGASGERAATSESDSGHSVEFDAHEAAFARLALERIDERQGDGSSRERARAGSRRAGRRDGTARRARRSSRWHRWRRPPRGRPSRARRRGRRPDREQGSCSDRRVPLSAGHQHPSAALLRTTTDNDRSPLGGGGFGVTALSAVRSSSGISSGRQPRPARPLGRTRSPPCRTPAGRGASGPGSRLR